jgi:hypothetical protein
MYQQNLVCITGIVDTDLSAKQYHFVDMDTDGDIVAVSTAGGKVLGVLQNNPNGSATQDKLATVAVAGIAMVKAGDVINPGAWVKSDDAGKAVALQASYVATHTGDAPVIGSYACGIHVGRTAAAANDLVPILLLHAGAVPTIAA